MDAVKRTGKPFIAAVSGVKNSGKTTFMEKLISELAGQGYRVAVIKHDGHEFQADREGTDTYRMRLRNLYFFLRTVAGGETAAGCPGGGAGRIFSGGGYHSSGGDEGF